MSSTKTETSGSQPTREHLDGDVLTSSKFRSMMLDMENIAVWKALSEGRLKRDDDSD